MADSAPITWFTEDPTPIIVGGILCLLVLGMFFLKSGRGTILIGMACVALVMGLAMLIDHLVVTDREQVANVIYNAAAAAERNDLDAVTAFISPSAPEVKAEARHWISRAKVESVSISAMEVEFDRTTEPMTATANFRVFATGQLMEQGSPYPVKYLSRVEVKMRREGARWLVIDCRHD